jgi:hypothetical protein
MERRSERIKTKCETTVVHAETNQATDIAPASGKLQNTRNLKKSTSSGLSGEMNSSKMNRTNVGPVAKQKSERAKTRAKRRKATTCDDKEDSNVPVKVFRGMRGKLRQLTEFPLDVLFEVRNYLDRS